jgi:2-polyprenyl-3-methyl-5-hydroxy-6-metoxy-1,4-benzoquinol methylase
MTMTMDTSTTTTAESQRDSMAARLGEMALATAELQAVYIGERLGLYHALHEGGTATPTQLAERAGIDVRYAREWLEQQAVSGFLEVDDVAAPEDDRRYSLPAGHAETLIDQESPYLVAPLARFFIGSAQVMPKLLQAYRTGAGVDWAEYGLDVIEAQEAINRPQFQHFVGEWIAALPEVAERLGAGGRVADVGCGTGWSSIWIARHFPAAHVDGIDVDAISIEKAQANAVAEGMTDRVSFRLADAGQVEGEGTYDLVTIFEALHDMPDPVSVLTTARRLLKPGGAVLVADERVAHEFEVGLDSGDRMFYAYSVLACLANGRVEQPSVATGTVIRPATLEAYARQAGFGTVSVLDVEHDAFRFYRLDA